MRLKLLKAFGVLVAASALLHPAESTAQITLLQDYKNYTSPSIGTFQGNVYREAGFSGLFPIAGTNGKEFWTISDRGLNVDDASANPPGCQPAYDKLFAFPNYAPKIHRIRIQGDSVQILQTITVKRPNGTNASGVLLPAGFGSTATEQGSTDTVLDCANFPNKIAAKDPWAIDCEGIVVDKNGFFWLAEENGPSIWKLNQNGVVVARYSPYANLAGAQPQDIQIDTAFKYRRNNRGFENISLAPNGNIYVAIQSPLNYPNSTVGAATRVHRIMELNPVTGAMRMLAYLNDGVIGAAGANQIRMQDWKLGDMAAINDSTFLILEAAARGTTDIKRMYKINITGATSVNSGLYGTSTLEGLVDSAGLATNNIVPVKKTLFMDLLANGWPSSLDKAEGLAIVNDSTLALCNDNDFGQTCPLANGIAIPTSNLSHVIKYGLSGSNKLTNYTSTPPLVALGTTGQSSSKPPYLVPVLPGGQGGQFTSIITAGDVVGGYKMCGTPDGLGAFDNGNGTFTLLMNHEFAYPSGVVRAHGGNSTFVSKWIINKSDLSVVSGSDLMQTVKLWNPVTSSYITYNSFFTAPAANQATSQNFSRFCSADLPPVTAFYNPLTGKGTQERIFMNGEESGTEGRAMGHIVTGPEAGTSYELPYLGKFSWENSVAVGRMSDTTVLGGMDDATPGQVYFYMGTKKTTGSDIEKAGLTGGNLYSVSVPGMLTETSASFPAANTPFTMVNLGQVQNMTGAALETASNNAGVTRFLRPEDGAWDPQNPSDFYFNTTNNFSIPNTTPSRLWKLHFTNPGNIALGGTITAVLDGTEGQQMLDNMTIDNSGHILLVEDVGNNAWLGRVLQYDIATDSLRVIGVHDSTRFLAGGASFITQDEEASGPIDAQAILGPGMYLTSVQAHNSIPGEVVEGGQLLAYYNPLTAAGNPEIDLKGNSISIVDGDITPSLTDNTDFGLVNTGTTLSRTFVIENSGPGVLNVRELRITGANAAAFTFVTPPALPFSIPAGGTQSLTVKFSATADSVRNATLNIISNDLNEDVYDVALRGTGASPEINIQGNSQDIHDGDVTAGTANGTDFGSLNVGGSGSKTYALQNLGTGILTINSIGINGLNQGEFTITSPTTFPFNVTPGSTVNFTVKFTPLNAGMRTANVLVGINDNDEGLYDFAVQCLAVSPSSVGNVNSASQFAQLYPNPSSNEATVSVTLLKEEHVWVSITGIDGREIMKAADKVYGAGENKISLNTGTLANGNYFVQIATGSQVTKIKMTVAH